MKVLNSVTEKEDISEIFLSKKTCIECYLVDVFCFVMSGDEVATPGVLRRQCDRQVELIKLGGKESARRVLWWGKQIACQSQESIPVGCVPPAC